MSFLSPFLYMKDMNPVPKLTPIVPSLSQDSYTSKRLRDG